MYSSRREVLGGAKSATACITLLRIAGKNNIGGFNRDCQTAKFNSLSNFPAIRYVCVYMCTLVLLWVDVHVM